MKKNKARNGNKDCEGVALLLREELADKVTSEQRPEGDERARH